MEAKSSFGKILRIIGFIIGIILVGAIILSWVIDYPDWLEDLLTNVMLVALGLVMLFQAYRIRQRDKKVSGIYLVIGLILIVVGFFSFSFIKIVAVVCLALFLLSRPFVKRQINKNEPQP